MQRAPSPHGLLAPPAQYSGSTVRRALQAWTRAGRRNPFPDVCRFYHYLEKKESALPEDQRMSSQRQDYEQLTTSPPTPWQRTMFPSLYPQEISNMPGLTQRPGSSGATPDEIVAVSEMIKGYCLDRKTSLREFLNQFSEYAEKYGINPTISNVAFFIQYEKVLQKERNLEELKQKSFKPIDDRYIREETKIEDDGNPMYELFQEHTFSLHNVLKEIIHVDQKVKHNDDADELQGNNVNKDEDKEEIIQDLIEWTDTVDTIDLGIDGDLLNDVKSQGLVESDTDSQEMTYAKVTGNKPKTYSSLLDYKLNQPEEETYTDTENFIDWNVDHIDSFYEEIEPVMDINETVEIQQEISEEVIDINLSEDIQKEIVISPEHFIPIETLTVNSTKPEVQAIESKQTIVTEKKSKKAKRNKKNKELENKENITTNTRGLVEIPFQLKSSEIGSNYFGSHQDKEICNKISTKIGVLKKNDNGNVMTETSIEGHIKKNKSLSEENETFYSIREEKDPESNSQERSEYVSIEDSKTDDLWTLDFTNFEAKAKVLKELFNRDLFELESLESDTSNLSGDFHSLKTQRFSTSSE